MAKNYNQSGNVITVTAPQPVLGGEGIVIEKLFGIATHAAQAGEELELNLVGVFRLPKDGTDISLGQRVYWNKTANVITTTASSNTLVGVAVENAAISVTQVSVRLNGSF